MINQDEYLKLIKKLQHYAHHYYTLNNPIIDDYEYDIIINGIKVDVKTISCKFKPTPNFLAVVNSCEMEGDHRQEADSYIFVRMREDCEVAWIVGYMMCEKFFDH